MRFKRLRMTVGFAMILFFIVAISVIASGLLVMQTQAPLPGTHSGALLLPDKVSVTTTTLPVATTTTAAPVQEGDGQALQTTTTASTTTTTTQQPVVIPQPSFRARAS